MGVGWTNTFAAALCWVGFACVMLCIRYGERMRAAGERWEGREEDGEEMGETGASEQTLVMGVEPGGKAKDGVGEKV